MAEGPYTIVIEDRHGTPVQEVSIDSGERIVGRFRECDIILPSENVSRRHARLLVAREGLLIEDLNSANGVFVNGVRIRERALLADGAVVQLGDYLLRVRGTGGLEGRRATHARLIGRNLTVTDQVFEVDRPTLVVGRGRDAGIALPDPSVSRVHARLIAQPDGHVLVEDMGSANGTFVNNQRVRIWQLEEGDILRFGNVEFLVEIPTADTVDGLKVTGWVGRLVLVFREHPAWSIASVLALVAVLVVGFLLVGSRSEPEKAPRSVKAETPAPAVPPSPPPSPASAAPDPLKEAMEMFARRDLDGAARIVDAVLRERPTDPDAIKMSNRIGMERRVRETVQSAMSQRDPVAAAALLLELPADSIFREDARSRLKSLVPDLQRRKARACGARKVVDCARLRGLVSRIEAILAAP